MAKIYEMLSGKKITKATFKSFVNKNRNNLLIRVDSKFDGQRDGCESTGEKEYTPIVKSVRNYPENDLGIGGLWLVNGGGDYFKLLREGNYTIIEVYNCCGTARIAVAE
jgi:hypothetical protein